MLTLSLPGVEEYAQAKTGPIDSLLEELSAETYAKMARPQMQTGPLEGRFLKMLVQISNAKRVLEIGMFTGYSALSMAEGLPADGELITLEIDAKAIEIASTYFARSDHGKKITIVKGAALDSLAHLPGPFDFAFIDADRANYATYYREVLAKLKCGGLLAVDNVLWRGGVINPKSEDDFTMSSFNDLVCATEQVERVLIPLRDGIFLIRKK